jgi:hypothetical protein
VKSSCNSFFSSHQPIIIGVERSISGGDHIHIFVFCIINLFWNRLFLKGLWTRIYEYAPPPTYRSFDTYASHRRLKYLRMAAS